MPAYDKQISVIDRWSIIAYIRALQNRRMPKRPRDRRHRADAIQTPEPAKH